VISTNRSKAVALDFLSRFLGDHYVTPSLRSFQQQLQSLNRADSVVAISVATPYLSSTKPKLGLHLTFRSDPKQSDSALRFCFTPGAGPKCADIAFRRVFSLCLPDIPVNLTENIALRARPEQMLEAFERGEQATPSIVAKPAPISAAIERSFAASYVVRSGHPELEQLLVLQDRQQQIHEIQAE